MEFSASEVFTEHPDLGRGIVFIRRGLALTSRPTKPLKHLALLKVVTNRAVDVMEVLVDEDCYKHHRLVYHFMGYTKVLFLPRTAIMPLFEKNTRAWKECARWKYLAATLNLHSLELDKERTELMTSLYSHFENKTNAKNLIVDTDHTFEEEQSFEEEDVEKNLIVDADNTFETEQDVEKNLIVGADDTFETVQSFVTVDEEKNPIADTEHTFETEIEKNLIVDAEQLATEQSFEKKESV